jgi:hypothetical protein
VSFQPGHIARLAGLALDDGVDERAVDHHEQVVGELHRVAARALVGLHQREDRVGIDRPADVDRVEHFFRRRVLGEQLAQRDLRRAVDDEADVLVIADGARDQDRGAVEAVSQLALRHQHDGIGHVVRQGTEGGGEGKQQDRDERFHAAILRRPLHKPERRALVRED